ncbi:LysR family transcriptional regulator [Rhodococcus oryzae]|uniref:LysR family transcriptional regulator n=1 Tax=Rhodococcus oryzae TaxID=2571143 RepID=A0ABY2RJV4_9NOCA|nr:LysR family transcriptional regulator [Rhodococcus oryzae]TJZ77776.1 LysR family transcriptional regulator [Rhodococcus oryzae]
MERRDIEIFLTLAEELHFGRTAERLHVSTARVSQTIKALERRVGAPLFERTSRRVTPTPIGRRLEEDLRPADEQIRAAIARAIAAGRGLDGELRVGFVGTALGQFVLEVANTFQERHPGCRVQIRESHYSDGVGLLMSDEIDGLVAAADVGHVRELDQSPVLLREQLSLAVSARHPFARLESVTIEDLARAKVLRPRGIPDDLDEATVPRTTPSGRVIERGPDFGTVQEMLALVGAGQGVFPVPTHASRYDARPDVTYVPVVDGTALEWRLIWRAAGQTSRIRAFAEAAQDFVAARGNPLLEG